MEDRQKHFERPTTHRPPSMFNLTIWAIFVGLVAGFGGYLLANYILPSNVSNYFNITNPGKGLEVSIDQPLINIANEYQQSIAGVYRKVSTVPLVGQSLFSQDDFLGSAIVVTSDGWLMTTDQVATNSNVSLVLGDKLYEVTEVSQDEFSGLVFLKIDENFLQPINFQLTDDLKVGEKLFTSVDVPNSYNHSFSTTYLSNPHYVDSKYLFTDAIDYYVKLADDFIYNSSPYFNLNGDLIGVSYDKEDSSLLISSEYIKQAVKNLLNKTERTSLGIRYVDMENNSGFEKKGVLVYNPQYAAVVHNSPAYKAGIKSGDQIVAVNNDAISTYRTLTSILQNYRPGDTLIIKILRGDQEQDMEVKL